jgi:Phage integrase family
VFCIIGLAFAARGGESNALLHSSVKKVSLILTLIRYRRLKQRGQLAGPAIAHITGVTENRIVAEYMALFNDEQKVGKFFKKLKWSTDAVQVIQATKIVVGKNKMADYCKDIARYLGLPNPNSYTGHTLRRTAITWAANAGLPLSQIKCLSGHRSDTVVQGYIDTSDHMRNITAGAVTVNASANESPSTSSSTVAAGGRTITLNITL